VKGMEAVEWGGGDSKLGNVMGKRASNTDEDITVEVWWSHCYGDWEKGRVGIKI